jgi:cytochrome oxidase Cu insertion factor (SCO1/SenC/PrrC family)
MRIHARRPRRTALVATVCAGLVAGCDGTPTEPPAASLVELFGETLHRADGSVVGIEAVEAAALVGIYFGSYQCPACAGFTPTLVDVYDRLQDQGRSFEVVYVSLDPTEASMFSYMTESGMSWLAVPWQGTHSNALLDRYRVQWIPTLIIIDGEGRTVSKDGVGDLRADGAAAYDDWLERSGS